MPLSEEQRRALQDRADGLRNEVTALTVARDAALFVASDAELDTKLIAEVATLELQRDEVEQQRDDAEGSAASAIELMNAAAAAESSAAEPAATEPTAPATKSNGLIGAVKLGEEG